MYALSHLHSLERGSVGGITYTANQFHQIVARQRTAPVQPNTPGQQIVKNAMGYLAFKWNQLSDATRAAWDDFAATCLYLGPAGTYTVPGRQMFIASLLPPGYTNQRGLYSITEAYGAPTIAGWLPSGPTTPAALGAGIGFAITVGNPNDFAIIALSFRSIAFNPGRARFKGPWVYESAQATMVPPESAALTSFSGLTENAIYFSFTRYFPVAAPFKIDGVPTILRHVSTDYGVTAKNAKLTAGRFKPTEKVEPALV